MFRLEHGCKIIRTYIGIWGKKTSETGNSKEVKLTNNILVLE